MSRSALRAWITARDRSDPLLVRRDPRDLSRVFVLDPLDGGYLEVPTRDLSRPAISLWEHRLARRRLRARHRGEVDEAALFAAVEEMRAAERHAARLTRSARRDRARRVAAPEQPAAPPSPHGLRRQLRRTLLVRAAAFRGIWQRPMFSANADRSAPSAKKRDFTQRTAGGAECREMSAPISAARWPLTYPARPLPDNDVAV